MLPIPYAPRNWPVADQQTDPDQIKAIRDYAAGLVGTRETIRRAGLHDYAELVIALARHDLDLPKPSDTPRRRAHLERASAILQPLLRHAH
ncbi:MAG TPA: hypothetical protein VIJ55_09390 [Acetobacteraceae bacterium]